MSADRNSFELGICPSPGRQPGKDWRIPVDISTSYDGDANRLTVTVRMLRTGKARPDGILTMYLCPTGSVCGCSYSAAVGWAIDGNCGATISWTWPSEAG